MSRNPLVLATPLSIVSFAVGVLVQIPMFHPVLYIPVPAVHAVPLKYKVLPRTDQDILSEVAVTSHVHETFQLASVVSILPAAAHVGSRSHVRFPVPFTSSVYHGVAVQIQIRVPVWKSCEL